MSDSEETQPVPLIDMMFEAETRHREGAPSDRLMQLEREVDEILIRLERQQHLLREVLSNRTYDLKRAREVQDRFAQIDRHYCELRDEVQRHRELFADIDDFNDKTADELKRLGDAAAANYSYEPK